MKISARYPAIELVTAALFVAAGLLATDFLHLLLLVAMIPVMVALAVIDFEHGRLPNILLLILAGLALAWRWTGDQAILTGVATAAAAGCVGVALDAGNKFITGKPGLGMGDTKLFAIAGLALAIGPFLLFLASAAVFGLVLGGIWLMKKPGAGDTFPFAPAILMAYGPSLAVGELIFQRLIDLLSG